MKTALVMKEEQRWSQLPTCSYQGNLDSLVTA
jgi:hypothetical protein